MIKLGDIIDAVAIGGLALMWLSICALPPAALALIVTAIVRMA